MKSDWFNVDRKMAAGEDSTSVSGGLLNDDDHCFHLSELNLKKYACALKCTARVVLGIQLKKIKPFKCFYVAVPRIDSQKKNRIRV